MTLHKVSYVAPNYQVTLNFVLHAGPSARGLVVCSGPETSLGFHHHLFLHLSPVLGHLLTGPRVLFSWHVSTNSFLRHHLHLEFGKHGSTLFHVAIEKTDNNSDAQFSGIL